MSGDKKRPLVGVGAIVVRQGKVLLGRRVNAHGEGTWAPPGGHLEFGESPEACARREVREETGLEIANVRLATATNDVFEEEGLHYVTLMMRADWTSGEAVLKEPAKCSGWGWFGWNDLPAPLFLPLRTLVQSGYRPET